MRNTNGALVESAPLSLTCEYLILKTFCCNIRRRRCCCCRSSGGFNTGVSRVKSKSSYGAAVYAGDGGNDITIYGCTVTQNTGGPGAGLYLVGGTLVMTNSRMEHNVATRGNGGAACLGSSTATISNSTFTNNHAGRGGALNIGLSNVTITDSTFLSNVATYSGGAIRASSSPNVTLAGNTLYGNTSPQGNDVLCFTSSTYATMNISPAIPPGNIATYPGLSCQMNNHA